LSVESLKMNEEEFYAKLQEFENKNDWTEEGNIF
jgi:hypothetical protein